MSSTIRAAIYETHGNPSAVLEVRELPLPPLCEADARVEMRAAPVNPADLNAIEGKYPIRPILPATPGMEGAGVIAEVGGDVGHLRVGDQVILPHNLGTWREACIVPAAALVVVPAEIEAAQAAMLKVNPITAWRMLHDFVPLRRGDWFIQNAANSGAGRAAIQIAHHLGFKSINVVRRAELIAELEADGADLVLVDHEKLRDEVKERTSGATVKLGLNAVGGESALRLANCLAPDATHVTYGAMSLQPVRVPNGLLIFKNLIFRGFWVNKWYEAATAEERAQTFAPLFEMAQRGLLKTKVEREYSLGEVIQAVEHAAKSERGGKIVLNLTR